MARKCTLTKRQKQYGHRVSHANNKTKHQFGVNLQARKYFVPELGKSVKLKLTTRAIRTIDKLGLQEALRKESLKLADVLG